MDTNTAVRFDDTQYNFNELHRSTSASSYNPPTVIKYIAPRVIAPNLSSSFQGPLRGIAWSKVGSHHPITPTSDLTLSALVQSSKFSTISSIHSIDGERIIDEHRELSRITEILCNTILKCCNLEAHNHAQQLQIDWLGKHIHHNRLTIERLFLTEMESAKKLIYETLQHKPPLESKLNESFKTTSTCDDKYQHILTQRNALSKELFDFERQIAQNNAESQFLQRRIHQLDDESKFYLLKNQNLQSRQVRLRFELDEEIFAQQSLQAELHVLQSEKISNEDIQLIALDDVHKTIDISQVAGIQPSKFYSTQLNQEVQRIRDELEKKIETYREELHRKFELELYRYQMYKTRSVPIVTKEHESQLEQYHQTNIDIQRQITTVHTSINDIIIRIETIEKRIVSEKNDQQSLGNRKQHLAMLNQLIQDRERQLEEALRIRRTFKQQVENYKERLSHHSKKTIQSHQNKRITIHENIQSSTSTSSSLQRSSFRSSLRDVSYENNERERPSTTRLPPSIIQSTSPIQHSSMIKKTREYSDDNALTRNPTFNAHQDCDELHRLLNDSSIDEMAIIRIFCNRTVSERLQIRDKYKDLYNRNIADDFEKIRNDSLSKFLRILLLSPIERDCFELKRVLRPSTIDENILVELLFSRSQQHIQTVKNTYQKLFKKTIEEEIITDRDNHSNRIFVAVLQANRPEYNDVNENEILQDARDLYETERKWRIDGSTFVRLLCTRSNTQLKQIFAAYQQFSSIDIEQTIRIHIAGSLYYTLMAIIRIVRNRPRFFAYGLKRCLKGIATNENDLNRIIATRCEIDIVQIQTEFEKIAQRSLYAQIQIDLMGNYKRALLELLRQHMEPNTRELTARHTNESEERYQKPSADRPTVQWREPINRFYSDTFINRSMVRSLSDRTVNELTKSNDNQSIHNASNGRVDFDDRTKRSDILMINARPLRASHDDQRRFVPTPPATENHSRLNDITE